MEGTVAIHLTGSFLRRRSFWLPVGLVVLGVAAAIWWRRQEKRPQYVTAAVTRGNIQRSITATGALNPVVTVQVGSYVSGTVKSLGCDFNTEVVVGQVRFDSRSRGTATSREVNDGAAAARLHRRE
jgi:HlyD family secretion protein